MGRREGGLVCQPHPDGEGNTTATTLDYLCSKRLAAKTLAKSIRRNRAIENELYWTLDVTFRVDGNRIRVRNDGAKLRHDPPRCRIAAQTRPDKVSPKSKRMRHAWNANLHLKVCSRFPCDFDAGTQR